MSKCNKYNPNEIFEKIEIIEFPITYVGNTTRKIINIKVDLEKSAYIKTVHEGKLMKFESIRDISPSHKAFNIRLLDKCNIEAIFTPTNECIYKAKKDRYNDNSFVLDLHIIRVDGSRCCYDEFHSEIGRYYISGQFEYSRISHSPDILNFGDVIINTEVTKSLQIRNDSNIIEAKLQYIKLPGFEIIPSTFSIPSNSSKIITVKVKPTSLLIRKVINFKIISLQSQIPKLDTNVTSNDDQFIKYNIDVKIKAIYKPICNYVEVESLHKLLELNPLYTYTNEEAGKLKERKANAMEYLHQKSVKIKVRFLKRQYIEVKKQQCIPSSNAKIITPQNSFCKNVASTISIYDLFNIRLTPLCLNFGHVAFQTNGATLLSIENNTQFFVTLKFLKKEYISFTNENKPTKNINLSAFSKATLKVYCLGYIKGNISSSLDYIIQDKYYRKHCYSLQVSNPALIIKDKSLKFGMVTPEIYTASVPLKIYNYFNISIDFEWNNIINSETTFEVCPKRGTIPGQSSRICDITYVCNVTKTKAHELYFVSNNNYTDMIPIELSLITRKICIKFLQSTITMKDIPLNLETIEEVKMENSSREVASFYVVDQLISGIRVEPMNGIIRSKEIITFKIIVKIPCPLEFDFDINVKINGKENVSLSVSGNIVEPNMAIYPKNINMTRIPSYMITYVPVTFQNMSRFKTVVEVLNSTDDSIFHVYSNQDCETQILKKFTVNGEQTKTVYIKIYDFFRREYDMYLPFKINGILGPPNHDPLSTELQYYIKDLEKLYENNSKIKKRVIYKDICFCRLSGVITVPWIKLSQQKFKINYTPNKKETNIIEFTMTNVSKTILYITILITKLFPNFTLNLTNPEYEDCMGESQIKFELEKQKEANFSLTFHPKGVGQFSSLALLYLDKNMTMPYFNLSFLGINHIPKIIPSTYRIIFPPCNVGEKISQAITLTIESKSNLDEFTYSFIGGNWCKVNFIESHEILSKTVVTAEITIFSDSIFSSNVMINFHHTSGSVCLVEVYFCFTNCPITLYMDMFFNTMDISYPYYPINSLYDLFKYMERCTDFLEKWMYQQGFHRDLYPVIPNTFHAISHTVSSQPGRTKSKGITVSYLSFIRRIAGPLMKHIVHKRPKNNNTYAEKKIYFLVVATNKYPFLEQLCLYLRNHEVEDYFTSVKQIHDTYHDIIRLLKSRGVNLWILQARFLLSYEQFVIYSKKAGLPKSNADLILTQNLIEDVEIFDRLNKQAWIDFILQTYKVFIMDNCFYDHITSTQPKNVLNILIDWYNINMLECQRIKTNTNMKVITNITTDLSDGIAIISSILKYCPYMKEHFSFACEVDINPKEIDIINNTCLITEALNLLKIYFPLCTNDFLEPNFLQMLFLSIHLYVTLPMLKPQEVVSFNPPLLKSSSRLISINSMSQESMTYNFFLLNNIRNNFTVEKAATDNGKKLRLNVKYAANFVESESATLLIYGYSKTGIFDTFIVFILCGSISALSPLKKCKVTGPLYRSNKVDVLIASPFSFNDTYYLYLTDNEPAIPVAFEENRPKFCIQRLHLIDKEIFLSGIPKDNGQSIQEHKLYLHIICLNTSINNTWIWFRSERGDFFIKITSHPRWDLALDTLYVKMNENIDCKCDEECDCYLKTVLMIPHRNESMFKSLRLALCENASEIMMQVFDRLINTDTGKRILIMLLEEGGTNIADIQHILGNEKNYRLTSLTIAPLLDHITLNQYSGNFLALPITLPDQDKLEKSSIILTSDCGMDIRVYKIMLIENDLELSP